MAPEICPACGAEVPAKALACPECGSDETTGWSRESGVYDGVDLPDTEFDYDEFAKKEFGGKKPGANWLILAVAVITTVVIILVMFMR